MVTSQFFCHFPFSSNWHGFCLYSEIFSSLGFSKVTMYWLSSCLSCSVTSAVSESWTIPGLCPWPFFLLLFSHAVPWLSMPWTNTSTSPVPILSQVSALRRGPTSTNFNHGFWKSKDPISQLFLCFSPHHMTLPPLLTHVTLLFWGFF